MNTVAEPVRPVHRISVVIPVYQGERTLAGVLTELREFAETRTSPAGHDYVIDEVLLVYDNGPDGSARVIRELEREHSIVRGVWLSRNYGQHAATLAGMASAGGDWIATIDEDGQHDPHDIAGLLDTAMREQATVVYAFPTNPAPHSAFRNWASHTAKWVLQKLFSGSDAPDYQSFRLVVGSVGRSVAAYAGSGVYLDVALGWVTGRSVTSPVTLRAEGDRPSGYTNRLLLSHFWRMVLSSGTRALRLISVVGIAFATIGAIWAIVILIQLMAGATIAEGWSSIIIVLLVSSGAILFSLGVIAQYVGVIVNMALGKPPYLIVSDPALGPLGYADAPREE
ncbi:glycosyltransferase [Homoserinimonas sp. OAct 916]|uniref:glycosyltransferase n=1 Tax=Homoserinimonas sp. OAct 916 TaxID=2211450 RepID=UPI0018E55231|nr:glycosyltransferase [Homoserinimonas sp. OAct 916]